MPLINLKNKSAILFEVLEPNRLQNYQSQSVSGKYIAFLFRIRMCKLDFSATILSISIIKTIQNKVLPCNQNVELSI